jgi:hypothetical protein
MSLFLSFPRSKHTLIDHNGFIQYEHSGYGIIAEFGESIVKLFEELG